MGLFSPGWKKSPEKAKKKIREAIVPEELVRVALETDFPGADGVRVRALAIDALRRRFRGKPGGNEALERLAREGVTPLARCQAAYSLNTDEGRRILRETIVEAYSDRGVFLTDGAEDWITRVGDKALQRAAFEAAPEDFRVKLAPKLNDPELQLVFIMTPGDEKLAKKVMDGFHGHGEEYARIALESPYNSCREAAIAYLGMDQESALRKLADGGSWAAQRRLLKLNLPKYAAKYTDRMTTEMYSQAIAQNAYSPEQLERLAMRSDVSRKSVAWAAMEAIDDPERLERILLEHETDYRSKQPGGPWESWILKLIDRLKTREETMVKYILSSSDGHIAALEKAALEYVHSPEALLRVAMEANTAAPEAAKRLKGKELAALSESKNKQVAEWAAGRRMSLRAGRAGEDDALEIMRWTLAHDKNRDRYVKALQQIQSQHALLTALGDLLGNFRALDGSAELENAILDQITDGKTFTDWCLANPRLANEACADRLRNLIAGTPEQTRFTETCADAIVRDAPELAHEARLLAMVNGTSAPETVWKTCGEQFLRRLAEILEKDTEKEHVLAAANRMKWLYRQTPEARSALEIYNGKKLTKHNDYYDETCAGNSRNRSETFTIFVK